MPRRPVVFLVLLASALGIPYVSSEATQVIGSAKKRWESLTDNTPTTAAAPERPWQTLGEPIRTDPPVPEVTLRPRSTQLEGGPIHDLSEVLRMDVTQSWVYGHWPRKSTALSHPTLYGVRVPLVTGTRVDDLAGSLTYYFDPSRRVQQLSFHGWTGGARKLIALLQSRYGFQLESPELPGEHIYQAKWNGAPMTELRIMPASVMWSNEPHSSFTVDLTLKRAGWRRYLLTPTPK